MSHFEYKHVEQKKTVTDEGEVIIDIINREALDGWVVHTINSAFGSALLVRFVEDVEEFCCANGKCSCQ